MCNTIVKEFWENNSPGYAHLRPKKKRPIEKMFSGYENLILNNLDKDLKDKTVIDYGCGGGILGELLFTKYNIKRYIGIDIAQRSIEWAQRRLDRYNTKFYLLPVNLNEIKCDILFTFAVFQHVASREMMEEILDNINNSNIKTVCIHYRYGEDVYFSNEYIKREDRNIGRCCRINNIYLDNKLSNYKKLYLSEVYPGGAQSIIYDIS